MKIGSYKTGIQIILGNKEFPSRLTKSVALLYDGINKLITLTESDIGPTFRKAGKIRKITFATTTAKSVPDFSIFDFSNCYKWDGPNKLVIDVSSALPAPQETDEREEERELVPGGRFDLKAFTFGDQLSAAVDVLNTAREIHGENFELTDDGGKFGAKIEY
jgi:hypothetical protein